jgi:Glycine zipper
MAWINRGQITSGSWRCVAWIVMVAAAAGCENAGQGALSGSAVGALSGLAIGSFSGDAEKGAAIGAIVGAVGGAVIGDQNRRQNEAAAASSRPAPPPSSPPAAAPMTTAPASQYPASPALSRMVGKWTVQGWVLDEAGNTVNVSGTADSVVDKKYFLRTDLRLTDSRNGTVTEGTSILGQEGGRRVTMVNSFSSSPEMKRFEGEIDESGSIFTLRQVAPNGGAEGSRRVTIRTSGTDRWTAEAWERRGRRDQCTESFTLVAAR